MDLLGKTNHTEVLKNAGSGMHTLTLNVSDLSPGVYVYCVEAAGGKVINKMIVQ